MNKHIKIYAEFVEPLAMEQFEATMKLDCIVSGVLLPDVHAGYTLPVGCVVASEGVVFPSFVGYDIGCGMCAIPTTFKREDVEANAKAIFEAIYKTVPVGFAHNQRDSVWQSERAMTEAAFTIFEKNGLKQLGSLGGGNHFIEIGYDETDIVWIIVHSGSRGIGHAVATHYMKLASGDGKAREGHFGFDVKSREGVDYITDMNFCLAFALENRKQIMQKVLGAIQKFAIGTCEAANLINRNHNHAELKDGLWIHRKGATHAEVDMWGVIPGNMRDGSFIVQGKGNPDALWSSSHGAGRVMGRKVAQRTLSLSDFENEMTNVTAKVDAETLDESPEAYKDIFEVMRLQSELVTVKHHVRPIINIKG